MYGFGEMISRLKKSPKTIVLTDGEDPRILEASSRLLASNFLYPILIGNQEIVVNSTYHFQVDKLHFYSIPYQFVGKKAKIVFDSEDVEVWIDMKRIVTHKRSYSEGYTCKR